MSSTTINAERNDDTMTSLAETAMETQTEEAKQTYKSFKYAHHISLFSIRTDSTVHSGAFCHSIVWMLTTAQWRTSKLTSRPGRSFAR